jgi:hypothetical protein
VWLAMWMEAVCLVTGVIILVVLLLGELMIVK